MPVFFRKSTDGTQIDCSEQLCGLYGGTNPTSCWIIGGGPSLVDAPIERIQQSPASKFAVNFAGRGRDGEPPLIKPTMWTAWDPTQKWHKSIFLDPSITYKFLSGGRTLDLVPGTSQKLCDSPGVVFLNHESRGFGDFLEPTSGGIVDCLDSFVQAIDIAYRLGFRRLYCIGTELIILPSAAQIQLAIDAGVDYEVGEGTLIPIEKEGNRIRDTRSNRLSDFVNQCLLRGIGRDRTETIAALEAVDRENQYHFSEVKSMHAAVSTDEHYYERVQWLRLSRRRFTDCGLKLICCTPDSRLLPWFDFVSADEACKMLLEEVGDPADEHTVGQYSGSLGLPDDGLPQMRDFPPHRWEKTLRDRAAACQDCGDQQAERPVDFMKQVRQKFDEANKGQRPQIEEMAV